MPASLVRTAVWIALVTSSAQAQPPASHPIPTILLTDEIMQPLALKLYGRKPELNPQEINPVILNQTLQRHAELVQRYDAVDAKAIYRTPNIRTIFISSPQIHLLQAAWLQIGHSDNYFVDDHINVGGTSIHLANGAQFQHLNLTQTALDNRTLQDIAANERRLPGSVILELQFLGPDIAPTLLPTVQPPPRPKSVGALLATVAKATFLTAQNQRFYQATLPPPDAKSDAPSQAGKLAAAGEPGDFDLFGIRTSMTLDEVKKIAIDRGLWTRDLGPFGARNWSKLVVGNSECKVSFFAGLPTADAPSEPGQFCLTVLYRGQDVVGLDGQTTLAGSADERRQLILSKYGAPYTVSHENRQLFLWGRRNDAHAKDEVTNAVPESVFQMAVSESYSTSPPPAGTSPDRWRVSTTVYTLPPPAPSSGQRTLIGPGTL